MVVTKRWQVSDFGSKDSSRVIRKTLEPGREERSEEETTRGGMWGRCVLDECQRDHTVYET